MMIFQIMKTLLPYQYILRKTVMIDEHVMVLVMM